MLLAVLMHVQVPEVSVGPWWLPGTAGFGARLVASPEEGVPL